jgi:hypothetical protein
VQHELAVESARLGYVFARNKGAYDKWRRTRPAASGTGRGGASGRGLTGDALERAVMAVSVATPEYVVVGE